MAGRDKVIVSKLPSILLHFHMFSIQPSPIIRTRQHLYLSRSSARILGESEVGLSEGEEPKSESVHAKFEKGRDSSGVFLTHLDGPEAGEKFLCFIVGDGRRNDGLMIADV